MMILRVAAESGFSVEHAMLDGKRLLREKWKSKMNGVGNSHCRMWQCCVVLLQFDSGSPDLSVCGVLDRDGRRSAAYEANYSVPEY